MEKKIGTYPSLGFVWFIILEKYLNLKTLSAAANAEINADAFLRTNIDHGHNRGTRQSRHRVDSNVNGVQKVNVHLGFQ